MYLSKKHRQILDQLKKADVGRAADPVIPADAAQHLQMHGLIEQTLLGWRITDFGRSIDLYPEPPH